MTDCVTAFLEKESPITNLLIEIIGESEARHNYRLTFERNGDSVTAFLQNIPTPQRSIKLVAQWGPNAFYDDCISATEAVSKQIMRACMHGALESESVLYPVIKLKSKND